MNAREDQKRQVQQATDIVRLIGQDMALRPKGKEFVGLCPFHEDTKPSMAVSSAKQIYKCFACGAGGDVFSWMMNYHKMTFPEAMSSLAERAGITLQRYRGGQVEGSADTPSPRQQLLEANARAMDFFRRMLADPAVGRAAREYLQSRAMSDAAIESFQIGYAPDRWDALSEYIRKMGWSPAPFEQAGLVSARKGGGHYDRLRHRLIFPICDSLGRTIAFGGRVLPGGTIEDDPTRDAKYLNSPETAIFNKSATLYGLHLAKKAIIASHTVVIVEGYTDVIACHHAPASASESDLPGNDSGNTAGGGARNVVATLGTAMTREHVQELRRYAEKVVLVFDADEAGHKAADRAVELFLTGEMDVAIAVLPEGNDPADLMAQPDGLSRWDTIIAAATDALDYLFARFRESLADTATLTGRQQLAEQFIQRLAQLGLSRTGTIRKAMVIRRLSSMLGVSEAELQQMMQARRQPPAVRATSQSPIASQAQQTATPPADENIPYLPDVPFDPLGAIPPGEPAAGESAENTLAPGESRSTLNNIRKAQRQIIGCLLQDNGLFHQTLADGRTFDEAVAPADFTHAPERHVYQLLYDALCEDQDVALAWLLSQLAEKQAHDLINLVTDCDRLVENACETNAEKRQDIFRGAVEKIVIEREKHHGRRLKQDIVTGNPSRHVIHECLEHYRQTSHPARILSPMRVRK